MPIDRSMMACGRVRLFGVARDKKLWRAILSRAGRNPQGAAEHFFARAYEYFDQ